MNKLKTGLLAVGGIAIGAVTLQRLRKRRSLGGTNAADDTHEAAESPSEHAAAAADHARLAGGKTVDVVRTELETNGADADAEEAPARGRLRRAGKGLIRR